MRRSRTLMSLGAAAALAAALLTAPATSRAAVSFGVSITIAPPPLPVYVQPLIPGPGYLWVPGYWAWGPDGYYWVPGTWVLPPEPGLLWTPGYWGWAGGAYLWHAGYWGPHVGFYGGINYGFGYPGVGFVGGYWAHGAFFYNRAVYRFGGVRIANVYYRRVVINRANAHVSYNGGRGGILARPTREELSFERERHFAPVAAQRRQERAALDRPELRYSANHGRPPIGATARPGQFAGRGSVAPRPAQRQFAPRQPQPRRFAPRQPQQRQFAPRQSQPRQLAPRRPQGPQFAPQQRRFAPQRQARPLPQRRAPQQRAPARREPGRDHRGPR